MSVRLEKLPKYFKRRILHYIGNIFFSNFGRLKNIENAPNSGQDFTRDNDDVFVCKTNARFVGKYYFLYSTLHI